MKNKILIRILSLVFVFSLLNFCFGISSSAEISEPEHTGMDPHYFYDVLKYPTTCEFYMDFSVNGVEYNALSYQIVSHSGDDIVYHARMYFSSSNDIVAVYEYVENNKGEIDYGWADPSYKTFVLFSWLSNDFLETCTYSASTSYLVGGDYSLDIDYVRDNISGSVSIPFPFDSNGVLMSAINIYGQRTPHVAFEVYFVHADGSGADLYGTYDQTRIISWECNEDMSCLIVDDFYARYEELRWIDSFLTDYIPPSPPPDVPDSVIIKGKFTFTDPVSFPFALSSPHLFNFITESGEVFSGMAFSYFPDNTCVLRFVKLSAVSFEDACSWTSASFNGFNSADYRTIFFTESTVSYDFYTWLSSVGIFDETADIPSVDPDPDPDPNPDPDPDPDPNPDSLSILPSGSYVFVEHLSPLPGSIPGAYIELELTFFSKGSQWGDISIYNSPNNKAVSQVYYTNVTGGFDIVEVYKNGFNGYVDTWESYAARIIRIPENTYVPTVFYNWFITNTAPFDDGGDDTTSFDNGVLVGFERGYEQAKDYYYKLGLEEGSKANGEDFLPNFFGSILDALDNLTIIGGLSFLDVLKMLVGLFVCLWVLKLLGGG